MYSLDSVFKDIREIISSVVIKYDSKGKSYDTLEITKAYDIYKLALEGRDSFYLYDVFDERSLRYAGITVPEDIELCLENKENIPENKRDLVVKYQRYITTTEYEEKNNYYRMLNGLPDIEDDDFIYIDIGVATELDIDYTIPIHKLTNDEILRIEYVGELARLQAVYPKPYLQYLGSYKIDIITARDASNFSILRMTKDITDSFYNEFQKHYAQCREYYMSVIFVKEFSKKYEKYDNFIAMMIMVMTIQRMFVNTFKYGIEREFYDVGSIKMLFDSYNVPFIEDLPISYQRILMKNLNNLLKYKSSDRVLFDICDILGFSNMNIYKYFLSKEHNTDEDGNPLFYYKEIIDEETQETRTVFDLEAMYSFKWKAVDLRERDIMSALLESGNTEEYNTLVDSDPFWLDDTDLRKRLYESEFNFIESKYLKMNIMYNLTTILFDTIYVFRMLADKKDDTSKLTIKLPKMFDNREIPLFNIVIFLVVCICKKNGLKGNIITTPSQTLSVLGFNFSADFVELRKFIKENEKWIDQEVLEYINNTNFTSSNGVNTMYKDIKSLYKYLGNALRYATTRREYNVHKKLFDTLMITEINNDIYRKSDGEIATTYLELLQDIDVDLYAFVIGMDDADLIDNIEHVILQIQAIIDGLGDFYYLSADNNILLNALIKLIDFFKSYTTDLTTFNILYSSNDSVTNLIKMLSVVHEIHKKSHESHIIVNYDLVKTALTDMEQGDLNILRDFVKDRSSVLYPKDNHKLYDKSIIDKTFLMNDTLYKLYSDILYLINTELRYRDSLTMVDSIKIIYET